MSYLTPKTDWLPADGVSAADLNRIEGNNAALKQAVNIDITDVGNYITATNVEAALQELGADLSTGKSQLATAITNMGVATSTTDTLPIMATKVGNISKDATGTAADVYTGKTVYVNGVKTTGTMQGSGTAADANVLAGLTYYNTDFKTKRTGTMPNNGAWSANPSAANVTIPAGYHNGSGVIYGDADLTAANIRKGISLWGITGTSLEFGTGDAINALRLKPQNSMAFSVGTWPVGMNYLFLAGNGYFYIAPNDGSKVIKKYNSSGTLLWTTATLAFTPLAGCISPDGSYIAAWANTNTLMKIRTSDGAVIWSVTTSVSGAPSNGSKGRVVIDSNDNIYVAQQSGSYVCKYNSSGTMTAQSANLGSPALLQLSTDGLYLWVACGSIANSYSYRHYKLQLSNLGTVASVTSSNAVTDYYSIVPYGNNVVATCRGASDGKYYMQEIYDSSGTVYISRSIEISNDVYNLTVLSSGIAVGFKYSGDMQLYDLSTFSVSNTIRMSGSSNEYIYVSNMAIDLSTNTPYIGAAAVSNYNGKANANYLVY